MLLTLGRITGRTERTERLHVRRSHTSQLLKGLKSIVLHRGVIHLRVCVCLSVCLSVPLTIVKRLAAQDLVNPHAIHVSVSCLPDIDSIHGVSPRTHGACVRQRDTGHAVCARA